MRRSLLVGMALGTLLTTGIWLFTTGVLSDDVDEPAKLLALVVEKPTDAMDPDTINFEGLVDPDSEASAMDRAIEIASACKLSSFVAESMGDITHTNDGAALYFFMTDLEDEQFNCLADSNEPPFVRLKQTYELCPEFVEGMVYDLPPFELGDPTCMKAIT